MNRRLLPAILIVAAIALPATAAPNFSGKWKLDSAKSNFGPMPAPSVFNRTVTHEDPSMEVSTTQSGRQGEATTHMKYTTDGKESVNTLRGAEVKSIVKWDGATLVISYKRETPQGEIAVEERWTLSEDGKTTTINSKISGGFGDLELKHVLDKQ
ncbi:MAG: hypothetical protein JJE04_23380 [Acidobacteriia bacterium]|nr:hypothetical protein [Terriglobia bacterium]